MSRVSEWEIERVWECERVRESERERVTFEHRHENKSCSACREWVNERLKEWGWETERVWEWLLSIHMKTKVVQNVQSDWMRECKFCRFPAFVWRSDIFSWEPALWTLISLDRVMRWSKKKHCNFRLFAATFEPRHENKNCSACLKDQLKQF